MFILICESSIWRWRLCYLCRSQNRHVVFNLMIIRTSDATKIHRIRDECRTYFKSHYITRATNKRRRWWWWRRRRRSEIFSEIIVRRRRRECAKLCVDTSSVPFNTHDFRTEHMSTHTRTHAYTHTRTNTHGRANGVRTVEWSAHARCLLFYILFFPLSTVAVAAVRSTSVCDDEFICCTAPPNTSVSSEYAQHAEMFSNVSWMPLCDDECQCFVFFFDFFFLVRRRCY